MNIDWQTITNNLRKPYGNLTNLAKAIDACPVHLRRLARGEVREPKFSLGVALLDLHYDHSPERHQGITL